MEEYVQKKLHEIVESLKEDRKLSIKYYELLSKGDLEFAENDQAQEDLLTRGLAFRWGGKLKIYPIYQKCLTPEKLEELLVPLKVKEEIGKWIEFNYDQEFFKHLLQLALYTEKNIEDASSWLKELFKNWETGKELQHTSLQSLADNFKKKREALILLYKFLSTDDSFEFMKEENEEAKKYLLDFNILQQNNQNLNLFFIPIVYREAFDRDWLEKQLLPQSIKNHIFNWTSYNNDLSQMIFILALNYPLPIKLGQEEDWVNQFIQEKVINSWENQREDIHRHLIGIQSSIIRSKREIRNILKLYREILENPLKIDYDGGNQLHQKLKGLGLVTEHRTRTLKVSNRLYSKIFDNDWIRKKETRLSLQIWQSIISIVSAILIRVRQLKWKVILFITLISAIIIASLIVYNPFDAQAEAALNTFKLDQSSALKQAIKTVYSLQNNTQKPQFEEYKTVKPILILQGILRDIYELQRITPSAAPAKAVASVSGKQQYLVGTDNGELYLYNLENQKHSGFLNFSEAINSVTSSQDLIALAAKDTKGTIKLLKNDDSLKILDTKNDVGFTKSIDFSPNGRYLVAGNAEGSVKLWKVNQVQEKFSLEEISSSLFPLYHHGGAVESVKFTRSGLMFAAAGQSGSASKEKVVFWKIEENPDGTIQKVSPISEPKVFVDFKKIWSIDFSPTQNLLAVAGDEKVCLWNSISLYSSSSEPPKLELIKCEPTNGEAKKVSFSPKQELIAAGSEDGNIYIWDYSMNLKEKFDIYDTSSQQTSTKGILDLSFSDAGDYLIASASDKTVRIWKIFKLWNNEDGIEDVMTEQKNSLEWIDIDKAEDNKLRVAFLKKDNMGEIVDLLDQNSVPIFNKDFEKVNKMKIVKQSQQSHILAFGTNGIGKFYKLSGEKDPKKGQIDLSHASQSEMKDILISPNGEYIAISFKDGKIGIWKISEDAKFVTSKPIYNGGIEDMSFSNDGSYLATVGEKGQAKLWQLDSDKKELMTVPWNGSPSNATMIRINPNDQTFITTDINGTVSLWDLKEGKVLNQNQYGHSDKIKSLKFSPDGQYFATLDHVNKAVLWKIEEKMLKKKQEIQAVYNIDFSPQKPNGVLLATGRKDENNKFVISLWDMKSREVAHFTSTMGEITHLIFSPYRPDYAHENYIVVADDKGTIKDWEIDNATGLMKKGCQWLLGEDYNDPTFKECLKFPEDS